MRVIILGGGASIQEGIEKGLWDRIQSYEKWSLNSIFKIMPYLPNRQVWVDIDFLDNNLDAMHDLHARGVPLFSKKFSNRKRHIPFIHTCKVNEYETTRERNKYFGSKALENNVIYSGEMGLCGTFAISLAIAQGYQEIFLLGYDFGSSSLNNKNTHVYQDRMSELNIYSTGAGRPEVYRLPGDHLRREIEDFNIFNQDQVKIWNVSLISNIKVFPQISYDEFFNKIQ